MKYLLKVDSWVYPVLILTSPMFFGIFIGLLLKKLFIKNGDEK